MSGIGLPGPANLARELEAFEDWTATFEQEKGLNFPEDVRERARMAGKKVPYKAPLTWPALARGRSSAR